MPVPRATRARPPPAARRRAATVEQYMPRRSRSRRRTALTSAPRDSIRTTDIPEVRDDKDPALHKLRVPSVTRRRAILLTRGVARRLTGPVRGLDARRERRAPRLSGART